MRPEMVENGLKFLRHPNVQTTPLSERVSFLEQKGMTKEEIQEAIEQYQNDSTPSTNAVMPPAQALSTAAPMVAAAAAPMQQLLQRRKRMLPMYMRVLLTISSVVGVATMVGFMWQYMVASGYFPWLRPSRPMLEAAKSQENENEAEKQEQEKEATLLASLESVSSAIQSQTEELSKLCLTIDRKEDELIARQRTNTQIATSIVEQTTIQAVAELKAEVSTLKALLLSKQSGLEATTSSNMTSTSGTVAGAVHTSSTPTTSASSPSAAVATKLPVVVKETSAQRMENALKKFRQENPMDQLKLASGILIMYVKNLVENPEVPRYRRIAPANANFKQKIEPLQHHEELLKSVGFESTGLNMEWKWHLLDRHNGEFDEHLAILKALLKALQALSSARSNDPLALEEIAHESLKEFYQQRDDNKSLDKTESTDAEQKKTAATSPLLPAGASQVGATTSSTLMAPEKKADTDLQAFMTRLEQKAAKTLEEKAAAPLPVVESEVNEPAMAVADQSSATSQAAAAMATETASVSTPAESVVDTTPRTTEAAAAGAESGGPAYPKSFTEVMELLKKGETVPGIQEIEDRVSDDAAKFLAQGNDTDGQTATDASTTTGGAAVATTTLPAKPWEKR